MDFNDVLNKRYSVRSFSEKEVEKEKVDRILEAIRIAPSGINEQASRVFVVSKKEDLKKIDEYTNSRYNAPLVLIIGFDKTITDPNRKRGIIDASISTTYGMLKATNEGLGSCWVMSFDEKEVSKAFKIDENIELVSMLPIGYPTEDNRPSEKHFERKEVKEISKFI